MRSPSLICHNVLPVAMQTAENRWECEPMKTMSRALSLQKNSPIYQKIDYTASTVAFSEHMGKTSYHHVTQTLLNTVWS